MSDLSNPELWNKIAAYDFDDPWVRVPFSGKLARQSGWPTRYVKMVIDEYRRFIYLACVSEELVCPSPDVDKVWHLHLTYTQDYWKRFCAETLGQEVHHYPSSETSEADGRLRHAYDRTLMLLTKEFGEKPPAVVWPAVLQEDLATRTVVDMSRNVVLPRAEFRFGVGAMLVVVCVGTLWHSGLIQTATAIGLAMFGVITAALLLLPPKRSKNKNGGCGGGACGSDGGGCGGGD